MDFAYIAFTAECAFGLDEAGVCRAVSESTGASPDVVQKARRCIGAQYVALLDASVEGLLTKLPKPVTRLLFARTESDGRIVLVRSGTLERFVSQDDVMSTSELPTVRNVEATPNEDDTRRFARVTPRPAAGEVAKVVVRRRSSSEIRAVRPGPTNAQGDVVFLLSRRGRIA